MTTAASALPSPLPAIRSNPPTNPPPKRPCAPPRRKLEAEEPESPRAQDVRIRRQAQPNLPIDAASSVFAARVLAMLSPLPPIPAPDQ
ncbi:hypothetical protein [Ramlibacter sp.]|uniref:hypothetical protein n=1 Tax=Ramlibacter sp. TaxID=1917967 RepID=UPI002D80270B|nr:hypothetical protein [Ramlibacter sp.]